VDKGEDIVVESWDVDADMETVQQKWTDFTVALRYVPGPSDGPSGARLAWVRPETEGQDEQIVFVATGPTTTRVNVAVRYDDEDLQEQGETFDDVSRRIDEDMALFTDYVEGRLPKDWPIGEAS